MVAMRFYPRNVPGAKGDTGEKGDKGDKGDPSAIVGIDEKTDDYSTVLADAGKLIRMGKATAQTFTLEDDPDSPFPVKTTILVTQSGAGQLTLAAGAGIVVHSAGNKYKLTEQFAPACFIKIAEGEWDLTGSLTDE